MAYNCCETPSCNCQTNCLNVDDWVDEPGFLAFGEPCNDYVNSVAQRHEAAQLMFEITGRQFSGCCPRVLQGVREATPTFQQSCGCPRGYGSLRRSPCGCCAPGGGGTLRIEGSFGVCPPAWLKRLASLLAFEFTMRDHCKSRCRLPSNFTTVNRDGITITRETGSTLLEWVREIDNYSSILLAPYLNEDGRLRRPGRVFTSDLVNSPSGTLSLPPICCPEDLKVWVDDCRFTGFEIHNRCQLVRTDGKIWSVSQVAPLDVVVPSQPEVWIG